VERMNLLVSDLDGTLLGDDGALDRFADWRDRTRERVLLVYSSGRFLDSIRSSIEDSNLPQPDAIIGGVGTEIFDNRAGRRIIGWPQEPFGWNPHIVRATCTAFGELLEQPRQFVSHFKVSFYAADLDECSLDRLSDYLAQVGQEVALVYSSNRDLDVLPARINKGTAADYLAERWRIDRDDVIVAGDSGNDRDMFGRGFRGIVVGNAHPELKSLRDESIYHAAALHAAGVIEGLNYWLGDE
jgi:sucrose-6F-phosphate phosphohydrolase